MEAPQTVHLKVGDQSPGPPPFSFSLLLHLALLSLGQQMNRSHLISDAAVQDRPEVRRILPTKAMRLLVYRAARELEQPRRAAVNVVTRPEAAAVAQVRPRAPTERDLGDERWWRG